MSRSVASGALVTLRYVGSSTIGQGAMIDLVRVFQEKTGIKFTEVNMAGSGEGYKALMAGDAPIAGMSCAFGNRRPERAARATSCAWPMLR